MTETWEEKARAGKLLGYRIHERGQQANLSLPAGARGSKTQRCDRKRSSHQAKAKGKDEGLPRSQEEGIALLLLFPEWIQTPGQEGQ